MSWSLKAHILDHSAAVHNTLGSKWEFDENDPKNQHFTFSCDIASLIINHGCKCQKDIDEKMKAFMDDLIKYKKTYREIKGKNKKGERTYRNVKFDFSDALLAYHNSASDSSNSNNYSVEPHFHALFHKSQKLSRGYKYLRDAIDEISKRHGIVFNFQEETGRPKIDSKSATDLTWFVKRSSDKDFKRRVEDGWVKRALADFQEHYKKTGNLQYLLKGYRDLEMRCKRLKILDHDLEFSIYLSSEQKNTIKTLYSGDKEKILGLVKDRSNPIGRAFLEHTHSFSNIIVDEIQKRTGEQLPVIELDMSLINQTIQRKVKVDRSSDFVKTLAYAYQKDLETTLQHSRDEKELKEMMIKLGYIDFAFKAKNNAGKRKRVGFTYKREGKTTTVYFNKLNMSMHDVGKALANSNNKSLVVPTDLDSHLKAYEPPKRVSYANTRFEQIYDLKSSLDLKGFFVRELDSKAVEFKAKKTYIVDNGNQISVKAQRAEDLERNVLIIADMVEAKKGIQRYNITGSEAFKIAMKAELDRREQLRASKVQQVQDGFNELPKHHTKSSDDELLKELSDMHLSKKSIEDFPEDYKSLFKIRSNSLAEKDINLLLKTYEVLPTIDNLEMHEKLISMARCLKISFREITDEIGIESGFTQDELDVFRETIKQMENYDSIYLDKFIDKLKDALNEALLLDDSISVNKHERNIKLVENLFDELDIFKAAHLNKKEYVRRIEDIEEALASDNFYEVQTLMHGLKENDKRVVEYHLGEKIDLAAAKFDFDQLKQSVDQEMKEIALLDNELLVDRKPIHELL